MKIRNATLNDIDDIMRIYDSARQTMRDNGNFAQWVNGYPSRALIEDDIARGECFVMCADDGNGTGAGSEACSDSAEAPHAVFMFALGDDPTYHVIEGGAWLNDEPYGVIHRIASDGVLKGVIPAAVAFGKGHVANLRIDTHEDNSIMRHVLGKAGFVECGTIYCADGTPRIAFHLAHA